MNSKTFSEKTTVCPVCVRKGGTQRIEFRIDNHPCVGLFHKTCLGRVIERGLMTMVYKNSVEVRRAINSRKNAAAPDQMRGATHRTGTQP